jgi:hypothetical protein
MKRVFAVLASSCFVLAIGCSDYDIRMGKTLEEKRYQKSLNTYLDDAPAKGHLKDDDIYIRPPKAHPAAQAFSLAVIEPGKFDVDNSFIDTKSGTALHVLARVKKPKPPPNAKKAAAPAEPPATRGKFIDDVVELLKSAYNVELTSGQFKPKASEAHAGRTNDYKYQPLDLTTKQVEIYVFTESSGVHEVAMIFEFPKNKENESKMPTMIRYCLQSFGVGDRAKQLYGGTSDVDAGAGEAIGSGAPPPI